MFCCCCVVVATILVSVFINGIPSMGEPGAASRDNYLVYLDEISMMAEVHNITSMFPMMWAQFSADLKTEPELVGILQMVCLCLMQCLIRSSKGISNRSGLQNRSFLACPAFQ